MDRRKFVKTAGVLATFSSVNLNELKANAIHKSKTIRITHARTAFEREKLIRPFGFKGGYLTELWQVASRLQSASGICKTGMATQSVLYGDANLFAMHSEYDGNMLMFTLVKRIAEIIKQTPFQNPVDLMDEILPEVISEAKKISAKQDLNINFIYNALVSLDNAAWLIYAAENNINSFEHMIPKQFSDSLSHRNDKIAIMFQIPYGMPVEEIIEAARQGYFVFKIKTGAPGTQSEMLEADMARLSLIHQALKELRSDHTSNGKLIYTMDSNARYQKKETLLKYLDHANKIGAFEQILLIEEPLEEKNEEFVGDLGVRIGADESVHDEESAIRRLDQGYNVMVLKGIAKTLSLSVKIASLAAQRNVPCMCADLTVNPILIDWHKNLAAHLRPFPLINMGLMETNGDMNYVNWKKMLSYHPAVGAPWINRTNGVFELSNDFYQRSGGIYESSAHYDALF